MNNHPLRKLRISFLGFPSSTGGVDSISAISYIASHVGGIFISKKHMQVGARFQVLLEKEIHSAGNNIASKQWRRKQRVSERAWGASSDVVENKCRRGAEHTINVGLQ